MYFLFDSLLMFSSMLGLPVITGFLASQTRFNSGFPRGPTRRADFSVFISELEGFYKSEDFLNVSSDIGIIDRSMSQNSLFVNEEGSSESNSFKSIIFSVDQHSVALGNIFVEVRQKGDGQGGKSSLLSRFKSPFSVGEVGVNRASDYLAV